MPLNKKVLRVAILFILVAITFGVFKILPSLELSAQEANPPVLVDLLLSKDTVNTDVKDEVEDWADQITLYVRASSTNLEGNLSVRASIAPANGCSGDDCWQPQAQQGNISLMYEGCDSLGELYVDGLEGGCGDQFDGIYRGTFDLPQYSALGDWFVYSISLDDTVGLSVPISNTTFLATTQRGLRNIGFENVGSLEDTQAPTIVDFGFNKESIDTTASADSITMYMRISDDMTSVDIANSPAVTFVPDNDPGYTETEYMQFEFALMEEGCGDLGEILDIDGLAGGCGDLEDGLFSATTIVPRYSSGGIWRVSEVSNLADLLGNSVTSLNATFTNTSTVYDMTAPELNGVRITPSVFNTTNASQVVTFELDITDDMAGVAGITIGLQPVMDPDNGYWLDEYTLDDGTVLDGKFILQVTIPQGAPLAFWKVNNIDIVDELNRGQRYTTAGLSLLFPDLPLYLVNQGTSDQVQLVKDWTLEDWPHYDGETIVWPDISIRFKAGTIITKQQGGVFAFHRMLATKYDLSSSASLSNVLSAVNAEHKAHLNNCAVAEGCVDASLNTNSLAGTPLHIIKMGIPGLNLSFSKPVTIIIGVKPEFLGSTFVIQTFDTEKQIWVNHGTCTVAMVIPESTEHGGDRYGGFRPIDYPGCSFTTDHASFFSANVLGASTTNAGVPNTGIGGAYNYFAKWLR